MIEAALVALLAASEVLHFLDRRRLTDERRSLQRMLYAEDKSERIAALLPETRKKSATAPEPKAKPLGI